MNNNKIHIIGISGKKGHGKDTVANIIAYLTQPNKHVQFINNNSWFTLTKWRRKSFAAKLKKVTGILLDVDPIKFEDEEYKNSVLWINPETNEEITPRIVLQRLGTEFGRRLHPDFWVNTTYKDFEKIKIRVDDAEEYIYPNWIFTDVRFPNEANAIREKGGIMIRVFRPGKLRVWFNDKPENEEDDFSGYYYLHSMEDNIYMLTEYADGKGSSVSATIDELTFDKGDSHPSETSLDHYDFDEVIINDGSVEDLIEKVKQVLIY